MKKKQFYLPAALVAFALLAALWTHRQTSAIDAALAQEVALQEELNRATSRHVARVIADDKQREREAVLQELDEKVRQMEAKNNALDLEAARNRIRRGY